MASYQRELDTSRTPRVSREQGGHRCSLEHQQGNKRPNLHYKENIIVDGFILARRATTAARETPVIDMLGQLPIKPESLAADTGYSAGPLRKHLEEVGITAYIPIHPNQKNSVVAQRGFTYHGDHLVCPEGKVLRRRAFHSRDRSYQYVAHQKDCQKCPVRTECLPPKQGSDGSWR